MQLQKMLRLLLTGMGVVSLGLVGCTAQQDLEARAGQTSRAQAPGTTGIPGIPQAPLPQTTGTIQVPERTPDVVYVPTPQQVVDQMLKVANVKKDDVLYDLGSGDGRIVITAAQRFGTRGVGIDIDPQRIQEARQNAQKAGVSDLVEFRQQDLFKTDLREATVVTLYLLPELNLKLRPKLFQELKPGTRVVSHAFDMGDWKPDQTLKVDGRTVYYWVIPEKVPENLRSES
ncbi:MAG: methyltransferase domain-containing protein [Leptolyngbyaceae bacterium]|nr:methyltransferase domain-containing protein [Leptolyngbyaceae bacterium]